MKTERAPAPRHLRLLGGLAGLVVGGFFGALIMVVAMIFTDRAFSILQGVLVGAAVGLLLGVRYRDGSPRPLAIFWRASERLLQEPCQVSSFAIQGGVFGGR